MFQSFKFLVCVDGLVSGRQTRRYTLANSKMYNSGCRKLTFDSLNNFNHTGFPALVFEELDFHNKKKKVQVGNSESNSSNQVYTFYLFVV